jgi:mannose-6-phosphate isomerase
MQVYKDSNHKPEMAIAITDFEALCGFVPHTELTDALHNVPELRELIGDV